MNINELENKYINLLLNRCINFDKSKSLFINYQKENKTFIDKLIKVAKKMGISDIYLDEEDEYKKHDALKKTPIEELSRLDFLNKQKWDEYALKYASFLILETEFPGLMADIDEKKLAKAALISRKTRAIYKKLQLSFQIPWCMAPLPNKLWAKKIFPQYDENTAYNKLLESICYMCMIDKDNPILAWNLFLKEQNLIVKKLNNLEIKKLHYENNLGTNLTIELNQNTIWQSAGSLNEKMIVNMPTYEIFTTPNYRKVNGIVYSSKPLIYNGGLINKFFIEFKDGKVANFDAEIGKSLLKGIIESDENSCFLGEVALVNYDSPISNTGLIFETTLIDENASCHLALGDGFIECVNGCENMNDDELKQNGINESKTHVDFMVGTSDLTIEADTKNGKVLIFKNGNFNI